MYFKGLAGSPAAKPSTCYYEPTKKSWLSLVEFKGLLYSSPMTTPRDSVKGTCSSLPLVGHSLSAPLHLSYDKEGMIEGVSQAQASYLSKGKGMQNKRERIYLLSLHYPHFLPLQQSSLYFTHPPAPI